MLKEIALGIIISLLFICLVILFCAVLIKLYIHKIKEHNRIALAFQKTLNSAILETQEQLLTSISQDLHDDAGQQLTVINFQLENFKLDYPDCDKSLLPISESVANLSKSLRLISHSLNNNWLAKNGLVYAIKSEINRIKNQKSITVLLHCDDGSKRIFDADQQIVIFRIFQETINNMLKHAKATSLTIDIKTSPKLQLIITDNGIGFDHHAEKQNTLGIENCRQRAKMINHTFTIESKLNRGTSVTLLEN